MRIAISSTEIGMIFYGDYDVFALKALFAINSQDTQNCLLINLNIKILIPVIGRMGPIKAVVSCRWSIRCSFPRQKLRNFLVSPTALKYCVLHNPPTSSNVTTKNMEWNKFWICAFCNVIVSYSKHVGKNKLLVFSLTIKIRIRYFNL